MLGLPQSTEYGKRIPKQKFYENITITPILKRIFVDQIKVIYWRNKIAASVNSSCKCTIEGTVKNFSGSLVA